MQDLLNLDAGPPSAAPAGPSGSFDALGGLGDAFGAAAPASAPSFPAITAFSKDGVSVSFAFSKPPGQPHVTDITATYTNSDAAPVSGFSLQVLPTAILPSAHHAALLGMPQIVRPCGCPKALASCIMIKHALQDILQSYAAAQELKNDVGVVAESLVIGFAICRHALQCASVSMYMYATASDSLSLDAVQAAVPKFMQLRLDPASGNALGPQGSSTATQALHVTNTMHGQKPLVMRLRIAYTKNGDARLEQAEVKNFPAGL